MINQEWKMVLRLEPLYRQALNEATRGCPSGLMTGGSRLEIQPVTGKTDYQFEAGSLSEPSCLAHQGRQKAIFLLC